jgi:plasmid stabilization system protein ParE
MAQSIELEWSLDALADLGRFSAFLQEHHPDLAQTVAREIVAKAQVLSEFPRLGRPIAGRMEYRQLVLQC